MIILQQTHDEDDLDFLHRAEAATHDWLSLAEAIEIQFERIITMTPAIELEVTIDMYASKQGMHSFERSIQSWVIEMIENGVIAA